MNGGFVRHSPVVTSHDTSQVSADQYRARLVCQVSRLIQREKSLAPREGDGGVSDKHSTGRSGGVGVHNYSTSLEVPTLNHQERSGEWRKRVSFPRQKVHVGNGVVAPKDVNGERRLIDNQQENPGYRTERKSTMKMPVEQAGKMKGTKVAGEIVDSKRLPNGSASEPKSQLTNKDIVTAKSRAHFLDIRKLFSSSSSSKKEASIPKTVPKQTDSIRKESNHTSSTNDMNPYAYPWHQRASLGGLGLLSQYEEALDRDVVKLNKLNDVHTVSSSNGSSHSNLIVSNSLQQNHRTDFVSVKDLMNHDKKNVRELNQTLIDSSAHHYDSKKTTIGNGGLGQFQGLSVEASGTHLRKGERVRRRLDKSQVSSREHSPFTKTLNSVDLSNNGSQVSSVSKPIDIEPFDIPPRRWADSSLDQSLDDSLSQMVLLNSNGLDSSSIDTLVSGYNTQESGVSEGDQKAMSGYNTGVSGYNSLANTPESAASNDVDIKSCSGKTWQDLRDMNTTATYVDENVNINENGNTNSKNLSSNLYSAFDLVNKSHTYNGQNTNHRVPNGLVNSVSIGNSEIRGKTTIVELHRTSNTTETVTKTTQRTRQIPEPQTPVVSTIRTTISSVTKAVSANSGQCHTSPAPMSICQVRTPVNTVSSMSHSAVHLTKAMAVAPVHKQQVIEFVDTKCSLTATNNQHSLSSQGSVTTKGQSVHKTSSTAQTSYTAAFQHLNSDKHSPYGLDQPLISTIEPSEVILSIHKPHLTDHTANQSKRTSWEERRHLATISEPQLQTVIRPGANSANNSTEPQQRPAVARLLSESMVAAPSTLESSTSQLAGKSSVASKKLLFEALIAAGSDKSKHLAGNNDNVSGNRGYVSGSNALNQSGEKECLFQSQTNDMMGKVNNSWITKLRSGSSKLSQSSNSDMPSASVSHEIGGSVLMQSRFKSIDTKTENNFDCTRVVSGCVTATSLSHDSHRKTVITNVCDKMNKNGYKAIIHKNDYHAINPVTGYQDQNTHNSNECQNQNATVQNGQQIQCISGKNAECAMTTPSVLLHPPSTTSSPPTVILHQLSKSRSGTSFESGIDPDTGDSPINDFDQGDSPTPMEVNSRSWSMINLLSTSGISLSDQDQSILGRAVEESTSILYDDISPIYENSPHRFHPGMKMIEEPPPPLPPKSYNSPAKNSPKKTVVRAAPSPPNCTPDKTHGASVSNNGHVTLVPSIASCQMLSQWNQQTTSTSSHLVNGSVFSTHVSNSLETPNAEDTTEQEKSNAVSQITSCLANRMTINNNTPNQPSTIVTHPNPQSTTSQKETADNNSTPQQKPRVSSINNSNTLTAEPTSLSTAAISPLLSTTRLLSSLAPPGGPAPTLPNSTPPSQQLLCDLALLQSFTAHQRGGRSGVAPAPRDGAGRPVELCDPLLTQHLTNLTHVLRIPSPRRRAAHTLAIIHDSPLRSSALSATSGGELYPYDVNVTRREHEGFGFVIISSVTRSGSVIGRIIENSPAERCNRLHVGDRILAVNGTNIMAMHHEDIVNLIKDSGYSVTLTVGPPLGEKDDASSTASNSQRSSQGSMINAMAYPAHSESDLSKRSADFSPYHNSQYSQPHTQLHNQPHNQPYSQPHSQQPHSILMDKQKLIARQRGYSEQQGNNSFDSPDSAAVVPPGSGDVYEVVVPRGARGFGFSIRGGREFNNMPLFVLRIAEGGGADADGRLRVGDQLLEINGFSTANMTHADAIDLIQNAGPSVRLLVRRGAKNPAGAAPAQTPPPPHHNTGMQQAPVGFHGNGPLGQSSPNTRSGGAPSNAGYYSQQYNRY